MNSIILILTLYINIKSSFSENNIFNIEKGNYKCDQCCINFVKKSPENLIEIFMYEYNNKNEKKNILISKYSANDDIYISTEEKIYEYSLENREYFQSNKEYIEIFNSNPSFYYIYFNKKIPLTYNNGYSYLYEAYVYEIRKDKSIIFGTKEIWDYLWLMFHEYPIKQDGYLLRFEDGFEINEIPSFIKECSNRILIFTRIGNSLYQHKLVIFIFNSNIRFIKRIKLDITLEEIYVDYLDKSRDNIILFYSLDSKINCLNLKYEDDLILGKSLTIFSNCPGIKDYRNYLLKYNFISMTLIEDYRIAAVCINEASIYYSLIRFNGNYLEIDKYGDKKLTFDNNKIFSNPSLVFYKNKGLVLYTNLNYKLGVKIYLNLACNSFTINDIIPYEKTIINFNEQVSLSFEEDNIILNIINLNSKIKYYINGKENYFPYEFNLNDNVTVICQDSDEPMILFYYLKKNNMGCQIKLITKKSYIYIMNEPFRCLVDPNITTINNIIYHDLNEKIFDINNKEFNFSIIYENDVRSNDLDLYFLEQKLNCQIDNLDKKKMFCNGYLRNLENIYQDKYYIYSKLSCLNKINIAPINIKDNYLKNFYIAKNLSEITLNLNTKYNPEERIAKFSIDMISYYYWFSGFSYCDDKIIENKKCCNFEILNNWDILEHKEYKQPVDIFTEIILRIIRDKYKGIKEFFTKLLPYIYNFVILKSDKYKKYIFGFPGTTSLEQLIYEGLYSNFIQFDKNEPDIKVQNYFNSIFTLIYKDLFSSEIIEELNLHSDYQIIFTGHSLGGAIATLASYYYAKNKLSSNEPVLITFGNPRVGNENFARDYMKLIPLVFRIARNNDLVTMIPPAKTLNDHIFFDFFRTLLIHSKNQDKFVEDFLKDEYFDILEDMSIREQKEIIIIIREIIGVFEALLAEVIGMFGSLPFMPKEYCHIGGLYILIDNIFYECKDFYNEDTGHPICRNWEYDNVYEIDNPIDILNKHGYLREGEGLLNKCQNKKFRIFL